ncbi:ABC transporter permease [Halobacteriaceae archaeon SHR40]|uniref:ABC transporter permease n=1 Tax=Halovenus amylolytica TaxID=2500550 RepID=UPI000FE369AE
MEESKQQAVQVRLSNIYTALSRRTVALPGVMFVVVVIGWEFGIPALGVESYILPTPSEILASFVEEYPTIIEHLQYTLKAFAVGFVMTVVGGYLLALAMAEWSILETVLYPYVIAARSIPIITLLPIFIVWLGFGFSSIVAISHLISFFAMVVNSLSGFKSTDEELVEMVQSFSGNRRDVFWNVYLYSSLPYVFAGIKICVILAFTGVIAGEYLVGTEGIGHLILQYNNSFATDAMFATILAISVTQLLLFGLVVAIERKVVSWGDGVAQSV